MPTWQDAVAWIREATQEVTEKQQELAATSGHKFPDRLPRLVAAARLLRMFSSELGLPSPPPSGEGQLELIAELEPDEDQVALPVDGWEADAWIRFLRLRRRQHVLENLQLETGDIVQANGSEGTRTAEVSSIGNEGRIYFKGGRGAGAWPDIVTVLYRRGDASENARAAREAAANQAAMRARASRWSEAKQNELEQFAVRSELSRRDVDELEEVIEAAADEKSIQKFIEARPQVLTSLLGGYVRFFVAHPRLGGDLVPDFFIADVDSLGIRWVLVEIETPQSNVTLQDDAMLENHARKGLSQVEQWREWLTINVDLARRAKRDSGLGFVDIRPNSEGLVLVGRRARLRENAHTVRAAIRERGIRVHTYDWLLDQLRGILSFNGPPGANPHLLHAGPGIRAAFGDMERGGANGEDCA